MCDWVEGVLQSQKDIKGIVPHFWKLTYSLSYRDLVEKIASTLTSVQ